MLEEIRVEVFGGLFLFAILFYQIQQAETKTLISLLIFTLWGTAFGVYLYWTYYQRKTQEIQKETQSLTPTLESTPIVSNIYSVQGAPKKGLVYLKENKVLMDMVQDLSFVKMFDRQKYQEWLVLMNHYQKTYMYILAERYPCQSYVPSFLDFREAILEIMYQYYIVVPSHFKHIYGVDPYSVIEKNIHTFLKLSRTMIEVLENFCRMDLKEHYFPMTQPMPSDPTRQTQKQNLLP